MYIIVLYRFILQEIEQMERQRSQAIESVEICNGSAKCQRCDMAVPIVGKIKWIEEHYHGLYTLRRHRGNGNIGNNINKEYTSSS
jgi:hypothetical protein